MASEKLIWLGGAFITLGSLFAPNAGIAICLLVGGSLVMFGMAVKMDADSDNA